MPTRLQHLCRAAFEWLIAILLALTLLAGLVVAFTPYNISLLVVASALLVLLIARQLGFLGAASTRAPTNYTALDIDDASIRYVDLLGRIELIHFADIKRVAYVLEEAAFPDLYGPYIESKWIIRTHDRFYIEVMDEAPHRAQLVAAFRQHLESFDERALSAGLAGLAASGEGAWECFRSPDCKDSPDQLQSPPP